MNETEHLAEAQRSLRCAMSTGASKPIRLSDHAQGYLVRRGFTETEVHETIGTNPWQPAGLTIDHFYYQNIVW